MRFSLTALLVATAGIAVFITCCLNANPNLTMAMRWLLFATIAVTAGLAGLESSLHARALYIAYAVAASTWFVSPWYASYPSTIEGYVWVSFARNDNGEKPMYHDWEQGDNEFKPTPSDFADVWAVGASFTFGITCASLTQGVIWFRNRRKKGNAQ